MVKMAGAHMDRAMVCATMQWETSTGNTKNDTLLTQYNALDDSISMSKEELQWIQKRIIRKRTRK